MFTFNYVWEFPFAKNLNGWQKTTLDGWTLSGITTFQAGNAYSVTSGLDTAGTGNWNERANLVGNPEGPKTVAQYFNPNKEDLKNSVLVPLIRKIDYIPCASEREALLLERRLIYRHQPFFKSM